jgi:AMMECR1 domain-containing protein
VPLFPLLWLSVAPDYVGFARAVVEQTVDSRRVRPTWTGGSDAPRPVFVTIEVDGKVRGCRGSLVARRKTLAEEVTAAATGAAATDPRHRPLQVRELARMRVTLTVIQSLEPLTNLATLTPEQGLVLRQGNRTGVVLPWEGRDPATRLRWAYTKAGLPEGTPATTERMFGERFLSAGGAQ